MLKKITVDTNKSVRITVERGAGDGHQISILRDIRGFSETLVNGLAIENGPNHKQTFNYGAFSEPSQYTLEPKYFHDGSWHDSGVPTQAQTGDSNHLIFNYHDHNATDDAFDLQVHFYMN